MSQIDDKLLSHLFKLSRIEEEHEFIRREKLITDLSKILDYFVQLQKVDTNTVKPLAGGTSEQNVWRDDVATDGIVSPEVLREAFPEKEQMHVKVPPVFE